jgi:hypothetical protein
MRQGYGAVQLVLAPHRPSSSQRWPRLVTWPTVVTAACVLRSIRKVRLTSPGLQVAACTAGSRRSSGASPATRRLSQAYQAAHTHQLHSIRPGCRAAAYMYSTSTGFPRMPELSRAIGSRISVGSPQCECIRFSLQSRDHFRLTAGCDALAACPTSWTPSLAVGKVQAG